MTIKNGNDGPLVKVSMGMGFNSFLALLFIAFKLLGIINWSWFWVLSPLWISFVLAMFVIIVLAIITLTVTD